MTTEEKKLRIAIRKSLMEMENVSESDILTRAGVNWQEMKPKFLKTVKCLVSKIDDDKYNDAEDLIGKAIGMLKIWKAKMKKGIGMVDRTSNTETLDEIDITETFGGKYALGTGYKKDEIGDKKYQGKLIDYILYNQGRNTDQREPTDRKMYCGYDLEQLSNKDLQKIKDNMEHPRGRYW